MSEWTNTYAYEWLDHQPMIGGNTLVWYYDPIYDGILTFII